MWTILVSSGGSASSSRPRPSGPATRRPRTGTARTPSTLCGPQAVLWLSPSYAIYLGRRGRFEESEAAFREALSTFFDVLDRWRVVRPLGFGAHQRAAETLEPRPLRFVARQRNPEGPEPLNLRGQLAASRPLLGTPTCSGLERPTHSSGSREGDGAVCRLVAYDPGR